jgi:hypothetical protein
MYCSVWKVPSNSNDKKFVAANARKFGFTMIITELEQATELHIVALRNIIQAN